MTHRQERDTSEPRHFSACMLGPPDDRHVRVSKALTRVDLCNALRMTCPVGCSLCSVTLGEAFQAGHPTGAYLSRASDKKTTDERWRGSKVAEQAPNGPIIISGYVSRQHTGYSSAQGSPPRLAPAWPPSPPLALAAVLCCAGYCPLRDQLAKAETRVPCRRARVVRCNVKRALAAGTRRPYF